MSTFDDLCGFQVERLSLFVVICRQKQRARIFRWIQN